MNNQGINQKTEENKIKLAEVSNRISAFIFDLIVFIFPWTIIYLAYILFSFQDNKLFSLKEILLEFQSKTGLIIIPLLFVYSGFLVWIYKCTLGKRYTNIAVVASKSFKKTNFLRAFLREAIKFSLFFIPYYGGFLILFLNVFLIKLTNKKQAVHDIIAGTQVITIPPNKKKKKFLNFFIFFWAAIFLISITGLLYNESMVLTKKIEVKQGDVWQYYENEIYGFKVKYPKEWFAKEFLDEPNQIFGVKLLPSEGSEKYIYFQIYKYDGIMDDLIKEFQEKGIGVKNKTTIRGYPAIIFETQENKLNLVKDQKRFIMIYSNCRDVFNKIMPSFSFTK
ncbi:MAG: RDD family protein [Patescibacteria group bacterium]|nr:RDD family protein [Patescibacteria group bacterium]